MIDRVTYQKLYPYSPYLNEKIGFESSVDEGQDPLEVLAHLKQLADQFHKDSNPQLDSVNGDVEQLPEVRIEPNAKEDRVGNIAKQIATCEDKVVLEGYKIIARTYPQLQEVYDKQMQLITSKTVKNEQY